MRTPVAERSLLPAVRLDFAPEIAPDPAPAVSPWREADPGLLDVATGWPLLAAPVPAGFPAPADDRIERFLSLDDHLVRNPADTFLVRVAGDALADAGLHDGDLLVIDRAVPPLAGGVVLAVAVADGAYALARLDRDPDGRLGVRWADGAAPDRPLDDAVVIAGVARWAIHRLWPGRNPVS